MPGVFHWGPLTALTIITVVTISSTYSALQLWGLPPSRVKYFRLPNFVFMYVWLVLILKNFYQALKGPGHVPLEWKPAKQSDEQYLQYCHSCCGYKPPRSHHCKQCKRCCKKMDHHCPWVNCCVGHDNHAAFTRFVFYVPFGCIHGIILNSNYVYRLLTFDFIYHQPYLTINMFWVIFPIAGIGLAIGTAIGVFILFAVQLKSICNNRTQIEDWITNKAQSRRGKDDDPFVYPYDLGCWNNFTQVINLSGKAKGDGIHWPLKDGCSEYDLTIEQLEQKKLKKLQAYQSRSPGTAFQVVCRVQRDYHGNKCPLGFGPMTCLCAPKCDEGKISVKRDDTVTVTRWQTFWVYGDKQLPQAEVDQGKRVRGWFPRKCIRIIKASRTTQHDNSDQQDVRKQEKGVTDSSRSKKEDGGDGDAVKKKPKRGGGSKEGGTKGAVRKRAQVKQD